MWWELFKAYLFVGLGFWLAGIGNLLRMACYTIQNSESKAESRGAVLGTLIGYAVGALVWPPLLYLRVKLALRPTCLPREDEDEP